MATEKIITHDLQAGTTAEPKWKHWGYSKEIDTLAYRPADACDFCKTESGKFFKTICHCGLPGARLVDKAGLKINASWAENGDYTIYCCENCVNRLTQLVQQEDIALLNHEILINVVTKMKNG